MTECKRNESELARLGKVSQNFKPRMQYTQGGTCFSLEHNMHVGALKG